MPKVSVIVPVYKVEPFLRCCVDSVLSQTFSDFELILVDDGSPDSCGAICDEYAAQDSRVRVVHKQNGGLSDARNAGLNVAVGQYVYFLDGDDFIEPELLQVGVESVDTGVDLVVFQYRQIWKDGSSQEISFAKHGLMQFSQEAERKNFIIRDLLTYQVGWESWLRIFRRDIIQNYGLRYVDNRTIFAEDLYFSLCYCSHVKNLLVLDKCLYNYRIHGDSIMRQNEKKRNLNRFNELSKAVLQYYQQFDDCQILVQDFHTIHYMITASRVMQDYRNTGVSACEYRRIMQGEMADLPFFEEQMSKQLRTPEELKPMVSRWDMLEQLAFIRYMIDGREKNFRVRTKILNRFYGLLQDDCLPAQVLGMWFERQLKRPIRKKS